jgi:tetratricopeptide (TPR) repeat protein
MSDVCFGMTSDARGNPVSTADAPALELFEQALQQYQSYVGDAVATIDRALAMRPDFVLGHVFRAGVLMTFGEQRFAAAARDSVQAAEPLAGAANDRERALLAAIRRLVDGDWHGACAALDRVLVDHPRDAFAIQTAHLFDFLRGDAVNLRNRITRVLPGWSARIPGYSYILGMHAFGLEECNQYAEARAAAERALALEPRDGWAVHAMVHVLEMQGLVEDGIHWLESRQRDWAPDNGFAFHNWWHLALFHLDRGDVRRVLELFDAAIYPEPSSDLSFPLVDASALLWRLFLQGADVGARAARIAAVWETKLEAERGFYAFNDVHALLAFAMAGREDASRAVLRDLEATTGAHANAAMAREVGLPVARGIVAFAAGHHDRALAELEPVRDVAHRFGGSHAQRDLLTLTIIEAALRGGRPSVARHYLGERNVQRPGSALGWRLHARATS